MSTTKSEAKIDSWVEQVESGNLQTNQSYILNYIIKHPNTTIYDIRNNLAIAHQTATAIVSMLMDEGVLRFNGKIKMREVNSDSGDTYSMLVYVADKNERKAVKKRRNEEKFIAWAKKGVNNFRDFISPEFFFELGRKANAEQTEIVEGDLTSLLK